MSGNDDSWANEAADAATESVVMQCLLDVHPAQMTTAELIRELSGGEPPGFAERDGIERAVRDLAGIGLLHRREELLTPTRAALRLSALLDR